MCFEHAAEGIVLDSAGNVVVIRTINLKGDPVWGPPKGPPRKDETTRAAALREVAEETGLAFECDQELPSTSVQYWFVDKTGERVKRQVDYWLTGATGGAIVDHDDEVAEVALLPPPAAIDRLGYKNEKKAMQAVLDNQ